MASGEIVVATLMLDFTGGDGSDGDSAGKNGYLSLEQLEGKEYVLWQGGVELLEHQVVGGVKSGGSKYEEQVSEYVVFANSETASLPKPAKGGVDWKPIGQSYTISDSGAVTPASVGRPDVGEDKVTATIGSKAIALFKAEYTAEGEKFTVQTALPVVVVFAVGRVK